MVQNVSPLITLRKYFPNYRIPKIHYLIPIKIRAPLIFTHLACAEIRGSKFSQYESAKIKVRGKNATDE